MADHNAEYERVVYLLWAADTYDASTSLMGVFASGTAAETVGRRLPKNAWGSWHVASVEVESELNDGLGRA